MTRAWIAFTLIAVLGAAAACPAGDSATPRSGSVTILHTNDWHGYALPEEPRGNNPPTGGTAAMAAAFAEVKAEVGADKVLALDAGDLLTGHPASAIVDEDGVVGGPFVRAWAAIGFDAWVIGNHDFDKGRKNAVAIVGLARAPCLVANLYRVDDGKPLLPGTQPYKVFDRGGLKVGVIGVAPPDLARLASAETMAGVKVFGAIEAAKGHVEKLDKECDVVVVVTHQGVDEDKALARAVPGIDVIVGGHSHTRVTAPAVEGTTLILQAGCNGREYGRLDLVVEGGKVVKHTGRLVRPAAGGVTPTADMLPALRRIDEYMVGLEREVIGETTRGLKRGNYYRETQMGSFVADAVKDACGTDVGLMNSGGIRAEFPKGRVSRASLLKVMPNDNPLVAFDATGAEIETICLHNARAVVTQDHGVLQVGGVRYRWKKVPPANGGKEDVQLLSVEVGGKPLEREKKYTVSTSEFIASEQGEKYFGYKPKAIRPAGKTVHQALLEAFKRGPIELPDRGRMWEEREKAPKREREPAGKGAKDDEDKTEKDGE